MAEFRLVAPVEGAPARKGDWRLTRAIGAAAKVAVCTVVPPCKARDNILRGIDFNTRPLRRKPPARLVDEDWDVWVHAQIGSGARRPAVSHLLWPVVRKHIGRADGKLRLGARELARELDVQPGHVGEALAEFLAMNVLRRPVDEPDGPGYVVNAHVLPEPGGLLLELEKEEHGEPVPLPARRGRSVERAGD